jgi:ATP-dependent DNA helicase RecG
MELTESLVKVLGDRTAKALAKMGLESVEDLLRHYPRRYVERGELTELGTLAVGEQVTILAKVASVSNRQMRNRKGSMLDVVVTDGTGSLSLTFFNQAWRERELKPGILGLFAGEVSAFRGKRQLTHPDYQLLPDPPEGASPDIESAVDRFAGALLPVYPASAALPSWRIATCVETLLGSMNEIPDPIPEEIRQRHNLMGIIEALNGVHRPRTRSEATQAHERLVWDEAFLLQVLLLQRRLEMQSLQATPRLVRSGGLLEEFDSRIPFELTRGQREVSAEIESDLSRGHPMHRLLQGEVGSGKTVVALRAMLAVVDAGGQAALLAPTEVLAQQHHRTISALMGDLALGGFLGSSELATGVALLTGSQSTSTRKGALLDIASGRAGIVIGTHALIQERVSFFDLGLVVVDEQHRFGVEQRDALRAKAATPPHLLVMTATPIPRTVAMTIFGDLDISTLRELPAGRSPIATHVVPSSEKPNFLDRTWERIREEVALGRQAYVVAPRIGGDESDDSGVEDMDDVDGEVENRRRPLAVLDLFPSLNQGALAGLSVDILHGRMTPEAKEEAMSLFASGATDVLIATTVIEVGVDVPNASTMVVMDADRFGVSQLHQLRGRVGRGGHPGLCLLVTESEEGTPARERLDAVASTLDGFALSQVDLEQRREGDVLGRAQSGARSHLRVLRVLRDEDVITAAREEARQLLTNDPQLTQAGQLRVEIERLRMSEHSDFMEKA